MDFTPTDPADLKPADLDLQAAALAAFNARAAIYQQGTEAVKQAAASQQNTEAGVNLRFLGKAMEQATFDPSQFSSNEVPTTPPKVPKRQFKQQRTVSESHVAKVATRPQPEHGEMSPQDALDMEVVGPVQIRFMEMLFELAGQLSMRQMMTVSALLCELTSSMLEGFEGMGCEGVGNFEGKGVGEGVKKDEEADDSDEEKCAMAMSGGNGRQDLQTDPGMEDDEEDPTWV